MKARLLPGFFIAVHPSGWAVVFGVDPHSLPMTTNNSIELCKAFLQYVLGPAVSVWVAAKVNAKPKRKRNASRKTSR